MQICVMLNNQHFEHMSFIGRVAFAEKLIYEIYMYVKWILDALRKGAVDTHIKNYNLAGHGIIREWWRQHYISCT